MFNQKPVIGNTLVPNPHKSAGKTAVCVELSQQFPLMQSRHQYPAGFYVKGKIDGHRFEMVKLIQLPDKSFLFPVPADIRRKLKKNIGDRVYLDVRKDRQFYGQHNDFFFAYVEEPMEVRTFWWMHLDKVQQHRYNEWIWLAKDHKERNARIARVLYGLRNRFKFEQMRKETSDWPKSL